MDFEINEGDPLQIIPLFERCLVPCALYEDIWCRYAGFMEKHAEKVMQEKCKAADKENNKTINDNENKCKTQMSVEQPVTEPEIKEIENPNATQVSEVSKNIKMSISLNSDKEVVDLSIVSGVTNDSDSSVRGSVVTLGSQAVLLEDTNLNSESQNDVSNDLQTDSNCENKNDVSNDLQTDSNSENKNDVSNDLQTTTDPNQIYNLEKSELKEGENVEPQGQGVVCSEPPTLELLMSELCTELNLDEHVLKCPVLTPEWIMSGVSWEDVRQIYRRGAWIHCPSKPVLLMQWAEFEESQGKENGPRTLARMLSDCVQ